MGVCLACTDGWWHLGDTQCVTWGALWEVMKKEKADGDLWASSEIVVLEPYGCIINSFALELYFQNHLSNSKLAEQPCTGTFIVLGHLQDQNAETKQHELFSVHYCPTISVLGFRCEGKLAHSKHSLYIFQTVLEEYVCINSLISKYHLLDFNMFVKKGFATQNLGSIEHFTCC